MVVGLFRDFGGMAEKIMKRLKVLLLIMMIEVWGCLLFGIVATWDIVPLPPHFENVIIYRVYVVFVLVVFGIATRWIWREM